MMKYLKIYISKMYLFWKDIGSWPSYYYYNGSNEPSDKNLKKKNRFLCVCNIIKYIFCPTARQRKNILLYKQRKDVKNDRKYTCFAGVSSIWQSFSWKPMINKPTKNDPRFKKKISEISRSWVWIFLSWSRLICRLEIIYELFFSNFNI